MFSLSFGSALPSIVYIISMPEQYRLHPPEPNEQVESGATDSHDTRSGLSRERSRSRDSRRTPVSAVPYMPPTSPDHTEPYLFIEVGHVTIDARGRRVFHVAYRAPRFRLDAVLRAETTGVRYATTWHTATQLCRVFLGQGAPMQTHVRILGLRPQGHNHVPEIYVMPEGDAELPFPPPPQFSDSDDDSV